MLITESDRRAFLGSIRDALKLLLFDTERMEEGYEYFHVVDFAAIFSYAHKKSQLPFLPTPGESEERTFARHQMALRTLFRKSRQPLLLIPPYYVELKNYVRLLAAKTELARADLASGGYKQRLARLIKESPEFRTFVQLRGPAPSATADSELQKAALEIGKRYFPELYAAVTNISSQGANTLQLLFRDNILRDSEEVLQGCRDMDYPTDIANAWYGRIWELRKAKEEKSGRAVQSWTDALACTYVQEANRKLNSAKKLVVFVSPSSNVETVLRQQNLILLPSGSKTVVRNLTYCLLAFAHRNDDGKGDRNDKALIKTSLETVENLVKIYKLPIPESQREVAAEVAVEWQKCENWLLMRDLPMSEDLGGKGAVREDEHFLAVLEQLYRAVDEDKHNIVDKVSNELTKLQDTTENLTELIRVDLDRHAALSIKDEGRQIFLEGLQDELPIPLSFSGMDVAYLARSLARLKNTGYSEESVKAFRKNILDKAKGVDATFEHHLLAGYLLAVEGAYDAALAELSVGRTAASVEARKECLFLSAVIQRKNYNKNEAIDFLEKALEIDGEDPRLNIEYAKALWMRWRENSGRQTANRDLDDALNRLKIAEKTTEGRVARELWPQIANVSAFILAERVINGGGDSDTDLISADAHIEHLRKLRGERGWVGRFFDTVGWVNYAKALTAVEVPEKKRLLELARREVEKGLTSEGNVETDVTVRREHLKLINRALSSLGY